MKPDDRVVTLIFYGEDLEPDRVSRSLGCEPSSILRQGDVISPIGRPRVTAKQGVWRLANGKTDQFGLEERIHSLLDRLTDDLRVWEDLTSRYRGELFCELWVGEWSSRPSDDLSPELIKRLADRRIGISLNHWYVIDDSTHDGRSGALRPRPSTPPETP